MCFFNMILDESGPPPPHNSGNIQNACTNRVKDGYFYVLCMYLPKMEVPQKSSHYYIAPRPAPEPPLSPPRAT